MVSVMTINLEKEDLEVSIGGKPVMVSRYASTIFLIGQFHLAIDI